MRAGINFAIVVMSIIVAVRELGAQGRRPASLSPAPGGQLVAIVDTSPPRPNPRIDPFPQPPAAATVFNNPYWFELTVIVTYSDGGATTSIDVVVPPGLSSIDVPKPVVSVVPKDAPGITITNCSIPTSGPQGSTILNDGWCVGCIGADPTPLPGGSTSRPGGDVIV